MDSGYIVNNLRRCLKKDIFWLPALEVFQQWMGRTHAPMWAPTRHMANTTPGNQHCSTRPAPKPRGKLIYRGRRAMAYFLKRTLRYSKEGLRERTHVHPPPDHVEGDDKAVICQGSPPRGTKGCSCEPFCVHLISRPHV